MADNLAEKEALKNLRLTALIGLVFLTTVLSSCGILPEEDQKKVTSAFANAAATAQIVAANAPSSVKTASAKAWATSHPDATPTTNLTMTTADKDRYDGFMQGVRESFNDPNSFLDKFKEKFILPLQRGAGEIDLSQLQYLPQFFDDQSISLEAKMAALKELDNYLFTPAGPGTFAPSNATMKAVCTALGRTPLLTGFQLDKNQPEAAQCAQVTDELGMRLYRLRYAGNQPAPNPKPQLMKTSTPTSTSSAKKKP